MTKVIVLGGGVAGLSAAQELVERGFEVHVYEKRPTRFGGKARSMPDLATGLPGEHGFRFFPGFYRHLPDSMSRIPFGTNSTVVDNLVATTQIEMTQTNGAPIMTPTKVKMDIEDLLQSLEDFINSGLTIQETIAFAMKMYQIVTSCPERRLAEYEKIAWWHFIGADAPDASPAYKKILGEGMTRSLVAMQAQIASTRTVGDILVQLLFDSVTVGIETDRVLNGPTNDVWLTPWVEYLTAKGVQLHLDAEIDFLQMNGRNLDCAVLCDATQVRGDYFIAAMPVEVLTQLLTSEIKAASPTLAEIANLRTSWMNGIQFYLKTDVPLDHGHCIYLDSEWALTSISQHQFWPNTDLSKFDNGQVNGILSVDISDWKTPATWTTADNQSVTKAAEDCTAEEVKDGAWAQIKAHVNRLGKTVLADENLVAWHLDPDIRFPRSLPINDRDAEPLLVNVIDSWQYRPEARIEIPNLFLASDYVRTYTDLATELIPSRIVTSRPAMHIRQSSKPWLFLENWFNPILHLDMQNMILYLLVIDWLSRFLFFWNSNVNPTKNTHVQRKNHCNRQGNHPCRGRQRGNQYAAILWTNVRGEP